MGYLGTIVGSGLLCILAAPALAQIPDEFSNLEVLPKDIGRKELIGIMRGYAGALGVRCIHCHVGDDPNDLDKVDFVSDERETKRVARAMMRMVDRINGKLLPAAGRDEPLEVGCRTCHHGLTRPQSLRDLLAAEIEEHGIDAAIVRYRELREEYYGRDAYDFGPPTLNGLAERIVRAGEDAEVGIALVRLNLEFHPDSHYTHYMLGTLLAQGGHGEEAAASVRRALELDPGNAWYQRTLQRIAASPAAE
jgi:hypothetical protein